MFDTVAISISTFRQLDARLLEENNAKPRFNGFTGEPNGYYVNPEKGSKEPRISVTLRGSGSTIVKAEASIGEWLHGSNLYLPDDNDLAVFANRLPEYVEAKIGSPFDFANGRVARLDVPRDFEVGEGRIIPIISDASQIRLARYNTNTINETTVNWDNQSKHLSKRYALYSKFHQVVAVNRTEDEIDFARNLLRFEVQYRTNKAVRDLADSLKLPSHQAKYILTAETAETVLRKSIDRLRLETLLTKDRANLEVLYAEHGKLMGNRLTLHLALKRSYGPNYYMRPFLETTAKTVKLHDRLCAQAGLFVLE